MNKTKIWFSGQSILILLVLVLLTISTGYGETFTFAIVADPHIDGSVSHEAKFITAIEWIIDNKDDKDIELVFVLGDIAWNGPPAKRNLIVAKEILDRLNLAGIPYVPIIGDNEIQTKCEKEFEDVFKEQYQYLSSFLPQWQKSPTPVNKKYLQNFSFDYKCCHFICCDFNSRNLGDEGGELHDFIGGSWPWFKKDIEMCRKPMSENIVIMTHIGMFRTGFEVADQYLFSKEEMNKIKSFIYEYGKYVDTNYAGHIHQNWSAVVKSDLFTKIYHVRATDETWSSSQFFEFNDQIVTVRWVQVSSDEHKVTYRQHVQNAK